MQLQVAEQILLVLGAYTHASAFCLGFELSLESTERLSLPSKGFGSCHAFPAHFATPHEPFSRALDSAKCFSILTL